MKAVSRWRTRTAVRAPHAERRGAVHRQLIRRGAEEEQGRPPGFPGPWRSVGSRRATQQILAGVLRIDPIMAEVELSLRASLVGLPVLTLFGRKNGPYGWQVRFQHILPQAVTAGIADGHHFPFDHDPGAYSAAICGWWAEKVAQHP